MTVGELAGLFNAEFLPEDAERRRPGRPGRVADEELAPRHVRRGDRAAVGDALPQHAAGRDRGGLPGHLPVRGHQPVRGPRHHAAVRADRRAVRRPPVGRGAQRSSDLPGVEFREAYFAPSFSKHTGVACAGVQLHVTDRDDFDAIRTAIAMIVTGRAALLRRVRVARDRAAVLDRQALRQRAGPAGDRRRRRRRRGGGRLARRAGRVPDGSGPGICSTPEAGREAAGRHRADVRGRASRGDRDVSVVGGRPGPPERRRGGQAGQAGAAPVRHATRRPALPAPPAAVRHAPAGAAAGGAAGRRCRPTCGRSSRRRPTHPLYAGGVVLASRHGVVPVHDAAGKALRYTDADDRAAGRPAGADAARHDLRPGVGDQDVHHDRGDAAGRGRPGRPRRAGRDVPAGLRRERQGRRHHPAPAHPHRRAAGLAAALQRLPDRRGTAGRRAGRRARRRARRGLRLLRPQPDHPGPGGRGGHRPTAGPGDRPRHHPPAADGGHDVQPAGRGWSTGSRPPRRSRGPGGR